MATMAAETLQIDEVESSPNGVRVLRLSGPLVLATLFEFQTQLRSRHAEATIIDLTGVVYMDSAGLGALLGFYASCQRSGHRYALAGINKRVGTMLEVAKVNTILKSYPTVEVAEAALV
jgi:anti-anti-sigma factor